MHGMASKAQEIGLDVLSLINKKTVLLLQTLEINSLEVRKKRFANNQTARTKLNLVVTIKQGACI